MDIVMDEIVAERGPVHEAPPPGPPVRRRRRTAISCLPCRQRKIRCDRELPCSGCVRSRQEDACLYDNDNYPSPSSRRLPTSDMMIQRSRPYHPVPADHHSPSADTASTIPFYTWQSAGTGTSRSSTPPNQPSTQDHEAQRAKIKQLEELLHRTTQRPPFSATQPTQCSHEIETAMTGLTGTFHVHQDRHRERGQHQPIPRSVTHKNRLFGQSHWMTGAVFLRDILGLMEPHLRDPTSGICTGLKRCKALARVVKAQREPAWPCAPTHELPTKDIADQLVDRYLRTTETIYRILHIPSFKRDYEALWESETPPDMAFLVQLKVVLVIGATTYDDPYSMRVSAVKWVYEAHTWLSKPGSKLQLTLQSFQTSLLLLLAREATGIGESLVWISAGAVLRTAVYIGLHRDPTHLPKGSTLSSEMRRRLWNTTLEIALQSSMTSGGPPLLSLEDFDTLPPCNFDDEQLLAETISPKPEDEFTQSSTAIALRKTLPLRLAIAKFLNGLDSHGTYEETLRFDGELRRAYKALRRTLQTCTSTPGPSPSHFEIQTLDFIMNRYISSLHLPFLGQALSDISYTFSRKVLIETSLKIWSATCSSPPSMMAGGNVGSHASPSSGQYDLARLATCGSGFFRLVMVQASFVIAVELRAQLLEEDSIGPVSLRPDLASAFNQGKGWEMRCLQAGETNIKGYLVQATVGAQVDGLMRSLGKGEMAESMVKAAEEALEKGSMILESQVIGDRNGQTANGFEELAWNTTPGFLGEDWDFMASLIALMSDDVFNLGSLEPMADGGSMPLCA